MATDVSQFTATIDFLSTDPSGSPGAPLNVRFRLNPDGSAAFPTMPNLPGSGTADLTIDPSGNLAPQTSSARFKENIKPLKDEFHRILSLEPKVFTSKATGQAAIGYIAEDLHAKDLNHLVSFDGEGKPLSVHYKMLPLYLLEIIKDQQHMIEQLKEGLADLKE